MCVVFVVDENRPSFEMVEKAWNTNPEGGGVAWRENGMVKWKKGLSKAQMHEMCEALPIPYVAHFRISTIGGTCEELTHPFPIEKDVPLNTEGETPGFVLFHNGHWGTWRTEMMNAIKGTGWSVPGGKWSDTRGMAWMAAHYGVGVLELIDEKAVAFGPGENDIEVFQYRSWDIVDTVWVSNRNWESKYVAPAARSSYDPTQAYHTTAPASIGGPVASPLALPPATAVHQGNISSGGSTARGEINGNKVIEATVVQPKAKTGGSSQEVPFGVVARLWGQGKLSKNQWKKALKFQAMNKPYRLPAQYVPLISPVVN